ncbi:MAG TPA: hypothetical protein VGR00_02530 [Thermoanaerobaculia bacterium]|nr:hypothetical protein [Thermoanaerobaculia bacterium]
MTYLDLHIHGAFGVDVLTADEAALDRLSLGLSARSIGAYLPTLVPLPLPELADTVARLSSYVRARREGDGRGAVPLGIHLEGPFVSKSRCGALRAETLLDGSDSRRVDAFFEVLGDLPGRSMVTLAPEIPGGLGLVRDFARRGFVVSIGHTEAGAATLDEARSLGASHMTHFANAMRPLHHRDVGPIGWGLLRGDVTVDVVADLFHLSPEMLKLVYKSKGASSVAVVSDAAPPAGFPDGAYEAWGEILTVSRGTVRNAAGGLAGSACLLDDAVLRLASIGVPAADARASAVEVPRRILGIC